MPIPVGVQPNQGIGNSPKLQQPVDPEVPIALGNASFTLEEAISTLLTLTEVQKSPGPQELKLLAELEQAMMNLKNESEAKKAELLAKIYQANGSPQGGMFEAELQALQAEMVIHSKLLVHVTSIIEMLENKSHKHTN